VGAKHEPEFGIAVTQAEMRGASAGAGAGAMQIVGWWREEFGLGFQAGQIGQRKSDNEGGADEGVDVSAEAEGDEGEDEHDREMM